MDWSLRKHSDQDDVPVLYHFSWLGRLVQSDVAKARLLTSKHVYMRLNLSGLMI